MQHYPQTLIISTQNEVQGWIESAVKAAFQNIADVSVNLKTAHNSGPVTAKELCKFLNISLPTCYRWCKKGRIPFLQIGGSIRFDKSAVIAAIENKKSARS